MNLRSLLKVARRKFSDLFSRDRNGPANAHVFKKTWKNSSPNHDDSVISGKLYVTVQTTARARIRVAGNTIPTAREEQDVIHFRGESRPALFLACDLQSDNFFPRFQRS